MLMAVGLQRGNKITVKAPKSGAVPTNIQKAVIDDGSTAMA